MKIKRAKNLNAESIENVVQVLDGWEGKLTWDLFIKAVASRTGCTYTRQALHRHERIAKAFQLRKQSLSNFKDQKRSTEHLSVAELTVIIDRCARLESENTRLRAENERLLLQFVTWAYNAHTRGLDKEFLNRPLQPIDREVTRLEAKSSKS
jgi:hypothetical protein